MRTTLATTSPPPAPARGRSVALAALVAALVLGVLGMHALATHGDRAGSTAMTTSAMSSEHMDALASGGTHADHSHPGSASVVGAEDSDGPGHGMGDMVMLCVAMLATAALPLLVLLVVVVRRRLRLGVFQFLSARAHTVVSVRDAGPPPVWQFSVIRC